MNWEIEGMTKFNLARKFFLNEHDIELTKAQYREMKILVKGRKKNQLAGYLCDEFSIGEKHHDDVFCALCALWDIIIE